MKLNWWQRYVLANADDAFIMGGSLIGGPVVVVATVVAFVGMVAGLPHVVEPGLISMFGGLCLGLVSGIVQSIYRRRFVVTPNDCKHGDYSSDGGFWRVLLVKEEEKKKRVVAFGPAVWVEKRERENVCCIYLPHLRRDEFEVSVSESWDVSDAADASFDVVFTIGVNEEFSPQELFDKVIACKCDSVAQWLRILFEKALDESDMMKQALAACSPFVFASLVHAALCLLPLDNSPLSNIQRTWISNVAIGLVFEGVAKYEYKSVS